MTANRVINHYNWLELYLRQFFKAAGLRDGEEVGMASAHGDKCYGYRTEWAAAGIPFPHGVAIYLLTYTSGYASEVRNTQSNGWVAPKDWVVSNYLRFQGMLPPVDESDSRLWLFKGKEVVQQGESHAS